MPEEPFQFDISKFIAPTQTYFKKWTEDVQNDLKNQSENVEKIVNQLLSADRIFLSAKGRMGLVSKYSGIRLQHAGFNVFEVGHEFTPPIGMDKTKKDVLLTLSGSGKTASVINSAEIARKQGISVLVVTSSPNSPLAKLATDMVVIKGKTKEDLVKDYDKFQLVKKKEPINYLGSESEFKILCFMELVVNFLAKRNGLTEEKAKERHTNME